MLLGLFLLDAFVSFSLISTPFLFFFLLTATDVFVINYLVGIV